MITPPATVLITGGTSGIGLALASTFLQQGYRVVVTGRDAAKLEPARTQLSGVNTIQADMANRVDLERLAAQLPDVQIVINNAGVQYNGAFAESPCERIEQEIATNLTGALLLTRLLLPALLRQSSAAILNISSTLAYVPKTSAPVYCATKAALHQFTRALRWQLDSTSVQVVEVVPPLVATAMTQGRHARTITPEQMAEQVWQGFERGQSRIVVGGARFLLALNRIAPAVAERLLRNS